MRLVLLLMIVANLYGQELKDTVIAMIEPPLKNPIVYINYDPFQKGKEVIQKIFDKKAQDKTLYITTILNNKVFINSRWYRAGETVSGFKIIQINRDSILAKNSKKVVKFGIKRRKKFLKVKGK